MRAPRLSRRLLVLPPIALGVIALIVMTRGRERPAPNRLEEPARPVDVLLLEPREIVPRAIGYGTARPGHSWRAVAEVGGRVAWVDPRLSAGELFPAERELVRIDDGDYKLAVARLEADISSTKAELARLEVTRQNTDASLVIAKDAVALAQRELERMQRLVTDGTVSPSSVDSQEQAVLRERSQVVTLESALRTADADALVLDAKLVADGTRLDEARRDVERTSLTTPFACRISSVDVETAQYVAQGAVMFEADGIAVAEVEAQMSIDRVRHLMRPEQRERALIEFGSSELWSRFGLEATVRLKGADFTFEWPARFERATGGIDPITRTVGFVAAVDEPYTDTAGRPPLVKGMFLEVEFRGAPLQDRIVVPISALHGGRAYLIDADGRLVIRPVELEFTQFDQAVIESGLSAGERLVLTDLIPAVPGMRLAPVDPPATR